MGIFIRLAHLHCESLFFSCHVCRLSSVCCLSIWYHISKTKRDRRQISSPLHEIGVAEQEYDVRFCTASS